MNVTIEKQDNVVILDVPNESIDASNCNDFKRDIEPTLEANARIVLDLANVQFVDSAGLGVMVWAVRQLASIGGEIRLCNVNGSVRALFELVRMHKLVTLLDSRDEAVASFA